MYMYTIACVLCYLLSKSMPGDEVASDDLQALQNRAWYTLSMHALN